MRRKLILISIIFGLLFTVAWSAHREQRRLAGDVVRLHVIASSDAEEDQARKLLVRDAVLAAAAPLLAGCDSRSEAEAVLSAQLPLLSDAAVQALAGCGCADSVKASLSREIYPTRTYDGFALPAGEYLSLRVVIGEGEGHNWWCVVYPPLCMAAATEDLTDMGLSEEEVALITQESGGYAVRFKLIEWVETLLCS